MHEHPSLNCVHPEVKYCEHCDIMYCKKCKGEWSRTLNLWQWPYNKPWYYGTSPIQVTWTTTSKAEDINHFHD